jgi:hypothetical protein
VAFGGSRSLNHDPRPQELCPPNICIHSPSLMVSVDTAFVLHLVPDLKQSKSRLNACGFLNHWHWQTSAARALSLRKVCAGLGPEHLARRVGTG